MEICRLIGGFFIRNWGALIPTAISLYALWQSHCANEKSDRALKIEEHREKDRINEQNAAKLIAKLVRIHSGWKIVIENLGESAARNLQVQLDGKPFQDHPIAAKSWDFSTVVGSGGSISANVLLSTSSPRPPYHIVLHWDDDAKSGNIYETSLTF